jgi:hypothetical protein
LFFSCRALLFVTLLHLAFVPFSSCVVPYCYQNCTLMLAPCSLAIALLTPYYFHALLFVVLLHLIIAPCYCTLLIGTPYSFSCACGGAWSNTNKLHPTTKVFVFHIS